MAARIQPPENITLGQATLPLEILRRKGAVNMTLRLDPCSDTVRLVLPKGVPLAEGLSFVEQRREWLLGHLERLTPRVAFADGSVIPILGRPHMIHSRPDARRGVWIEAATLCVSGSPEYLQRRVRDFLKEMSRNEITRNARDKAHQIGADIGRITLKDTRGRWGSCTPEGDLSFSWRLLLAPPYVLDYVVAHEVAHLRELNHSARFWRLVAKLTLHMAEAKSWLRRHGASLHRYG
ncbi:MAG: M48 family metallopeptidase [Alphaproteobacteria bacterium]|jgi:predicted metal-dependent hydrolase|nr:M48 family metallopeptidase [Alphaproteobacteria bacterium]